MITIENKIPPPNVAGKNNWKAALEALEVGESFSFDPDKRTSVAYTTSQYFHKYGTKRFTISADPENPTTMLRVWRIADAITE